MSKTGEKITELQSCVVGRGMPGMGQRISTMPSMLRLRSGGQSPDLPGSRRGLEETGAWSSAGWELWPDQI